MIDFGTIIEFLKSQYASYGYLIIFLGAFAESTILLGLLLPGSTMLILGAVFAAQGTLSLPLVIAFGWAGMFLGCCTDYLIGRAGLWEIIKRTPLHKWLDKGLKDASLVLHTKGGRTIFLSHLMGQVRTFVAVTAGIVKMPFQKFAVYELPTTLSWAVVYSLVGYLAGNNIELIQQFFSGLGLVAFGIAVIIYLWWKRQRKFAQRRKIPVKLM